MLLMRGHECGIFGSFGQARRDYNTYCMLHQLSEIMIAVNSKKGKKVKKPVPFSEYDPQLSSFFGAEVLKDVQALGMTAQQTISALGIKQSEVDDASTDKGGRTTRG